MAITKDGAEVYPVGYLRGQHEALQGTVVVTALMAIDFTHKNVALRKTPRYEGVPG